MDYSARWFLENFPSFLRRILLQRDLYRTHYLEHRTAYSSSRPEMGGRSPRMIHTARGGWPHKRLPPTWLIVRTLGVKPHGSQAIIAFFHNHRIRPYNIEFDFRGWGRRSLFLSWYISTWKKSVGPESSEQKDGSVVAGRLIPTVSTISLPVCGQYSDHKIVLTLEHS